MSDNKHVTEDGIVTSYGWGVEDGEPFISFDADFGRDGMFRTANGKCAGCGEQRKCLHVDQSEGEYKPGVICLDCIERLFERHKRQGQGEPTKFYGPGSGPAFKPGG